MSQLDLFSKRLIQTDIEDTKYVYYYPLVAPGTNSGPIEFFIPGNDLDFIDLKDISLGIHAKVVGPANANLANDANVAPVNNWLHSLFSDVTISLNDTTIEGGSHLYPYKAYLTNLFLYGREGKKSQLQASGWAKDQAGNFNEVANTGFVTRKAWISESTLFEMEGPLLLDICMQGKLLLNQVNMRIKLTRSSPLFNLLSLDAQALAANVTISTAYLKVKHVKVSPDRIRQIESGLALQNAIYPIQRTELVTYTVPQGIQSHVRENLFHSRRPKMLVIGMLPNADFNGTYKTNPFRFPHLNLTSIGLYIDGMPIPHIPLTPNYPERNYAEVYRNLFRVAGFLNDDGDLDITMNDFVNGYTLYGYVLSPDGKINGNIGQPQYNASIRIEVKFSTALTNAINILCMAVYDDEVQISRLRKVTVDYMS